MKLTNGSILNLANDMVHLCGGGNRLATLAALRAARIRDVLVGESTKLEEHRQQWIKERNGQMDLAGQRFVFATPQLGDEVNQMWDEALTEERELAVETLTMAEVEAGYFRARDGRKEPALDLSPDQLGRLVRLGIVVVPAE